MKNTDRFHYEEPTQTKVKCTDNWIQQHIKDVEWHSLLVIYIKPLARNSFQVTFK